MIDRLARESTGAEKRCRFCRGNIPPDQRRDGAKRAFSKVFCNKVCRSKYNTMKSLLKKYDEFEGRDGAEGKKGGIK